MKLKGTYANLAAPFLIYKAVYYLRHECVNERTHLHIFIKFIKKN